MVQTNAIKNIKRVKNLEIPGFKGDLYDFQTVGVVWLYRRTRCLLSDMCGLGKTIQCLGLLSLLKHRKELNGVLIAVPSVSVRQWSEEIKRFTDLNIGIAGRTLRVTRYKIYNRANYLDGILINHEILFRDLDIFNKLDLDCFILDEASCVKNHKAKTSQAAKKIAKRCSRVVAMSATPVQNDLTDIHSIFELIDNRILGNYWRFKNKFCVEEDRLIYVRGMRRQFKKIVGSKNVDELKNIIEPYYFRRRICDVEKELPNVIVRDVWLDMKREQWDTYSKLKNKAAALLVQGKRKEFRKNIHTMQQCVDGLGSLDRKADDVSSKLDYIMELLRGDLCEEKVVIFSVYKNTIRCLEERLLDEQINYIVVSGDVSRDDRDKSIKEFRENKHVRVCIGTVAMEMSLNLQVAGFMILIDRLWNPTRIEQIVGRVRRLGSKHSTVMVLNIMIEGTMEEGIYEYIKGKQALSDYVFDEQSEIFERLPEEKIAQIIGIGK